MTKKTRDLKNESNWTRFYISPPPSRKEIHDAIHNDAWQEFRMSLLGLPLADKYDRLKTYLKIHTNRVAKVRVHNYVYALKRGGLVK